jgi:hypothetical protein
MKKRLINQIKDIFDEKELIGVVRRHDSIILVTESKIDVSFLNEFEFLGVKGWFQFDVDTKENSIVFEEHYKEAWE